jgi:hypothetical protein
MGDNNMAPGFGNDRVMALYRKITPAKKESVPSSPVRGATSPYSGDGGSAFRGSRHEVPHLLDGQVARFLQSQRPYGA